MSDAKQQSRQWKFSDGEKKELEECLGPEQSAAFADLFELFIPHLSSADVRRTALKAASLLKQVMDCVDQDGVDQALRAGTEISQEDWETWKSTTRRLGLELQAPRGRPIDHEREVVGALVGFIFKWLDMPATRSREGAFAKTCAIAFKALGHPTPDVWNSTLLTKYDRAGHQVIEGLKAKQEFLQILAKKNVPDEPLRQRVLEHLLEIGPRQKNTRFRKK